MGATLQVGSSLIGHGQPSFVIAEAGVNHNGDVDLAHRLIDTAVAAGADAVKFQTFDPEALAAADAPQADYQKRADEKLSQREMLASLCLPVDAHRELRDHARSDGIEFLSSPFDWQSALVLDDLDLPALKLASGELTNHPFVDKMAGLGRPLLVSTGMSNEAEVAAVVEIIRAHGTPFALFHCVSRYPAPAEVCNLRAMDTMRQRFRVPVGWSDHTEGLDITLAAAALGADMIEKHFTLDRSMEGPDHKASVEPDELATMVRSIRAIESALGDGIKQPVAGEEEIARVARKSLHWARDLPAGAVVSMDDLVAMRPGTGIPPEQLRLLVGRALAKPATAGRACAIDDLETET